MPVPEFIYLLAGMMDIEAPDLTAPMDELVQKRLREAMDRQAGTTHRPRRRRR